MSCMGTTQGTPDIGLDENDARLMGRTAAGVKGINLD